MLYIPFLVLSKSSQIILLFDIWLLVPAGSPLINVIFYWPQYFTEYRRKKSTLLSLHSQFTPAQGCGSVNATWITATQCNCQIFCQYAVSSYKQEKTSSDFFPKRRLSSGVKSVLFCQPRVNWQKPSSTYTEKCGTDWQRVLAAMWGV